MSQISFIEAKKMKRLPQTLLNNKIDIRTIEEIGIYNLKNALKKSY